MQVSNSDKGLGVEQQHFNFHLGDWRWGSQPDLKSPLHKA